MKESRYSISILLENQPGALSRVANLFSARGYNIESLSVSTTTDDTLSRMSINIRGNLKILKQICRQLEKLVDVHTLEDFTNLPSYKTELALIQCHPDSIDKIKESLAGYNGYSKINQPKLTTHPHSETLIIELCAENNEISKYVSKIHSEIISIARSGSVALALQNNYNKLNN